MGIQEDLKQALIDANDQGERVLVSLWPQDKFMWRKEWWVIDALQWDGDEIHILTKVTGEDGKQRTFRLHGLLIFPAMLSDEHFESENEQLKGYDSGMWL